MQKVNDIQHQVDRYKSVHGGRLPEGVTLHPGLYVIASKQAGTGSITLSSIYSGQPLAFIMDKNGTVYADYSFDIMTAIDKAGGSPAPSDINPHPSPKIKFYPHILPHMLAEKASGRRDALRRAVADFKNFD